MPTLDVEFEIFCAECGTDLGNGVEVKEAEAFEDYVFVPPCEKCLEAAKDEGDAEGYAQGEQEALAAQEDVDEAYERGRKEGYAEGYDEGYKAGVEE